MILNCYENKIIKNPALPAEWKSQESLDELLDFLQSNWEQRAIFYDDGKVNSKQQFLDFIGQKSIRTKDYVGTIAYKGHQLNIFPKVFKEFKDDDDRDSLDLQHLMHNLVKWIEYTAKIDYPYISISADMENTDNLQELFISLYVRYVKAALDRGLFFRYEEKTEDLPTIRGRLDIKDYIIKKYPNGQLDKFQCTYSTFEFDNLLNRIIKCTLKFVWNIATPSNCILRRPTATDAALTAIRRSQRQWCILCGAQRPLVRCQRSLSGGSGRSCQSVVCGLITTV